MGNVETNPKYITKVIDRAIKQRVKVFVCFDVSKINYTSQFTDIVESENTQKVLLAELFPKDELDKVEIGDQITIYFLLDDKRFACSATLLEADFFGNLKSLVISFPEELQYLQRRDYYRMIPNEKVTIDFKDACIFEDESNITETVQPDLKQFLDYIYDLSEGGISCNMKCRPVILSKSSIIKKAYLKIPNFDTITCNLQIKHVQKVQTKSKVCSHLFRIGMQFLEITGREQRLIAKYIMDKQREFIKKMRENSDE